MARLPWELTEIISLEELKESKEIYEKYQAELEKLLKDSELEEGQRRMLEDIRNSFESAKEDLTVMIETLEEKIPVHPNIN